MRFAGEYTVQVFEGADETNVIVISDLLLGTVYTREFHVGPCSDDNGSAFDAVSDLLENLCKRGV